MSDKFKSTIQQYICIVWGLKLEWMCSWLILAWTKQDADIMFSHSMHPNTTIQPHTCWNSPSLNLFVFVTPSWLQIAEKWKAIKLVPATDVCQGFQAFPLTSIGHCHCHWCWCCPWHLVWVYLNLLVLVSHILGVLGVHLRLNCSSFLVIWNQMQW